VDVGDDPLLISTDVRVACTPPFIGSRGADVKLRRQRGTPSNKPRPPRGVATRLRRMPRTHADRAEQQAHSDGGLG